MLAASRMSRPKPACGPTPTLNNDGALSHRFPVCCTVVDNESRVYPLFKPYTQINA